GRAGERLICPESQNDHGRLQSGDVLLAMSEAFLWAAETGHRFAPDGVAAPAEVAEGDVLVRMQSGQHRFPVAIALLALDQRADEKDDAVAVFELKRLGGMGERGDGQYEKRGKRAVHGASPDSRRWQTDGRREYLTTEP